MPSFSKSRAVIPWLSTGAPNPKGEHEASCVLDVGRHEDIQVARGSRDTVDGQGMCSDDQEANSRLLKGDQEISEVVMQDRATQFGAPGRRRVPGVSSRS